MRSANFFDLLNAFQITIAGGVCVILALELYFLIFAWKRHQRAVGIGIFVLLLGTLIVGLILRASMFPGGGLYDPSYEFDRVEVAMIQEDLAAFKKSCGSFPTTEQGLRALVEPQTANCFKSAARLKREPKLRYISDGMSYELEGTRTYWIRGLIVRGTDKLPSQLFIRGE